MTAEDRRRLGAIAALVLGVFAALTLIPAVPTGPLGRTLGDSLWRLLGAGAIGLPLLGVALFLAGFDHLPRLDMKRAAWLTGGLAMIVPFAVGVAADITPLAFDPPLADWSMTARLTGLLPGFAARAVVNVVGQPGGALLAFLALSALTLLTVQWHPLRRLERRTGEIAVPSAVPRDAAEARVRRPVVEEEDDEDELRPPPRREPKGRKESVRRTPPLSGAPADALLPPITLLKAPEKQDTAADEAQLDRLGLALLETLRTFKVDGAIAGRTSGPVVTQFEIVPAPGVKAGRIVSLADDLGITMRATSIRVAPIPGKGAVGVEVPNPTAKMVTLRELLESGDWERARSVLPIALGRDLEGKPVVADLARMPHLLIAGATGSGKSVAINTIVTGLIYRYPSTDLRMLMVDPKMVELSMYNALPHLRHTVVTNNHDAARVLRWAVQEMNRRYELFHANGARNVIDFNRKVEEGRPLRLPVRESQTLAGISAEPTTTPPAPEAEAYTEGRLPYIVIVVDELADLMMTVQGEVETPLAMLAQKARAIGIHLILATQRPSVNVLTGLIKANFPSRIAFRVASKVDSRTILDQNGAEALLGNGDMLFLPPGKSEPQRIQGAFIGTEETEALMEWFRAHAGVAAPRRAEDDILAIMRAQERLEEGGEGEPMEPGERDVLFREAAEVCIQNQGGSTSLLQRKLRIGYGRAARIIDQLHEAGILGPPDGSKPREVQIGLGQLDEYCGP
ncbi:MAG: DNA translocase FtsK [Gemmatimonadales bacterium]